MFVLGPTRSKLMVRDAVSVGLGVVPLSWLEPVRRAHTEAVPGSSAHKLLTATLQVLRYRKLDASLPSFSIPDHPDLKLVNADSYIARRVYWLGQNGYEGNETQMWAGFCAEAQGILEVGANIGYYTVLGSRAAPETPYVAVEPHPRSAQILRQNLELNSLDRVSVLEAAMVGSKSQETMELSIPDEDGYESPCGAFLTDGMEGIEAPASRSVQVKVIEASDVVRARDIDLMKIDVEGHEYEILSHIQDWIGQTRPTMFMEVLPKANELRRLVFDFCNNYDYRVFAVGKSSLEEAPKHVVLDQRFPGQYGTRDIVLASRREWLDFARTRAN